MKYSYLSIKGDPSASHDDSHRYFFPYRHGTKFKISQGYKGKATHYGENEYSLDFGMKTGTRIVAARDGLVVEVKEDSNIGGPEEKYDKHGNYVLIYHSDGTFANYVHLKQNGAIVDVNDRVIAGQVIGLSGNTGRSSGPHLHFSVSKPTYSGKRVTIPVRFLNFDGESVDPEVSRYYYSTHYGKDDYKVILGDNIRNEQYDRYFKKIKSTGKVKFRTEVIDDTILVFVRNGTNSKISMVAGFKLDNLSPSKEIPVKRVVRPRSEIYLCFLRRINNKKGYSFSTQCEYRKTK